MRSLAAPLSSRCGALAASSSASIDVAPSVGRSTARATASPEIDARREALDDVLRHALRQRRPERADHGRRADARVERRGRLARHLSRRHDRVVAAERALAGRRLVERRRERELIGRRPEVARRERLGRVYAGVPSTVSARVIVDSGMRAMPKSAIFAPVREKRMFSGLMSRWMTPAACADVSAEPSSRAMLRRPRQRQRALARGDRGGSPVRPRGPLHVLEDEEQADAVVLAHVVQRDDVRVATAAAACASWRMRVTSSSRTDGGSAGSSRSTFIATWRPSTVSAPTRRGPCLPARAIARPRSGRWCAGGRLAVEGLGSIVIRVRIPAGHLVAGAAASCSASCGISLSHVPWTARGQRGWKAQPVGGSIAEGASPASDDAQPLLLADRAGHRAEQRARVRVQRRRVELLGRALLDDAAEVHDRDAVADVPHDRGRAR